MNAEEKARNYRLAEALLAEQSFGKAVAAGLVAALATAAVWAMLAAVTGHVYGVMAMGVGAGVGYAVQVFGKGIQAGFAILAALLAFAGCLLGNAGAVVLIESIDHQMPVMEILGGITATSVVQVVLADFGLLGLLIWLVAISIAGYFAQRRLTKRESLAMFTYRFR